MTPPQAILLGPGQVGRRLVKGLNAAGWEVTPVTRVMFSELLQGTVPQAAGVDSLEMLGLLMELDASFSTELPAGEHGEVGPIILAMREGDLVEAFRRFRPDARKELVLVQNGFLEAGLTREELAPVTRGLIWYSARGDEVDDLRPSILHGPWAERLAAAWNAAGIPFEVAPDRRSFLEAMIVKGFWNCIIGLPLAAHGVDLGTYLDGYRDEIAAQAHELCAVCAAEYGVQADPDEAIATLDATTTRLRRVEVPRPKALEWRNGPIARWGRQHGIPTPVTDRLLATIE